MTEIAHFPGRSGLLLLVILMTAMGVPSLAHGELPPMNSTLGVRGAEDILEGYIDLMGPLWAPDNGLLFLNPRGSLRDEGENEFNIGLGYRQLVPAADIILGVNGYFDSRKSRYGNRFNQFGAGVEFLSPWVDARANYYLPEDKQEVTQSYWEQEVGIESATSRSSRTEVSWENIRPTEHKIVGDGRYRTTTTTKTTTTTTTTQRLYEQFEAGRKGWDAEIGGRLPLPDLWPEMRIFGGYYDFEGVFGEDIQGVKGRFEMRTGPYLTFNAEVFEDKELNDTEYFVGLRLQIPFSGANPFSEMDKLFAPAVRSQRERLSQELVMRDVRVQMEESDFMEDASRRTVDVDVSIDVDRNVKVNTEKNVVLAKNITFVNGSYSGDAQNGTAENPYTTVQAGADNAGNNRRIFLFPGTYNETVSLHDNQTLTSVVRLGRGAGSFTVGAAPTINGGGGYGVTLADNNTVERLRLSGDVGIFGEDIHNAAIRDVAIDDVVDGIVLLDASGSVSISNTTIDASGFGIVNWTWNGSSNRMEVIDSAINTGFMGIWSQTAAGSSSEITVVDSTVDSGFFGMLSQALDNSTIRTNVYRSTVSGFIYGIGNDADYYSNSTLTVTDSSVGGTIFDAVSVMTENNSSSQVSISGSVLSGGEVGYYSYTASNASNSTNLTGNTIQGGLAGIGAENDGGTTCLDIRGNAVTGLDDIYLDNIGGTFQVVDLPHLGGNNGGAGVFIPGTSQPITDCPYCL